MRRDRTVLPGLLVCGLSACSTTDPGPMISDTLLEELSCSELTFIPLTEDDIMSLSDLALLEIVNANEAWLECNEEFRNE